MCFEGFLCNSRTRIIRLFTWKGILLNYFSYWVLSIQRARFLILTLAKLHIFSKSNIFLVRNEYILYLWYIINVYYLHGQNISHVKDFNWWNWWWDTLKWNQCNSWFNYINCFNTFSSSFDLYLGTVRRYLERNIDAFGVVVFVVEPIDEVTLRFFLKCCIK